MTRTSIKKYSISLVWQYAVAFGIATGCTLIIALYERDFGSFISYWVDPYAEIASDRFLRVSDKVGFIHYLYQNVSNLDVIIRMLLTPIVGLLSLKYSIKVALVAEGTLSLISLGMYLYAAFCY